MKVTIKQGKTVRFQKYVIGIEVESKEEHEALGQHFNDCDVDYYIDGDSMVELLKSKFDEIVGLINRSQRTKEQRKGNETN